MNFSEQISRDPSRGEESVQTVAASGGSGTSDQQIVYKGRPAQADQSYRMRDGSIHNLKPQHRLFVMEYLKDFNANAAAKRAGYSGRSGHNNNPIYRPAVKAAIEAEVQYLALAEGATKNRVLAELVRVAFSEPADMAEWVEAGVKVSYDSKVKGLEILAKHLGMFSEHNKRELTVRSVEEIIIDTYKGTAAVAVPAPVEIIEHAVKIEYDRQYGHPIEEFVADPDEREDIDPLSEGGVDDE